MWPDQEKDTYKYKDKYNDLDKYMTWLVNFCEIVKISDSWEPEIMTIICEMTIKSDTGQHLQFLQCLLSTFLLTQMSNSNEKYPIHQNYVGIHKLFQFIYRFQKLEDLNIS